MLICYFDGVEDLENELAELNAAIGAILRGGQSYTINSGGGSRQVTYADYNALIKRRDAIRAQLAAGNDSLGVSISAGW